MTEQSPLLVGRKYDTDEVYVTGTRQVLTNVHDPEECEGGSCCIHAPSRHPLVNAPTHWRVREVVGDEDVVLIQIMERICPCGIFHPDADDLLFLLRTKGEEHANLAATHNCCGCCEPHEPTRTD